MITAIVASVAILNSLIAFILYAIDKQAAIQGETRIPETTLHLVGLLGGWPGAMLAQRGLRHKTRKASFQRTYWLTVLVNSVFTLWLLG